MFFNWTDSINIDELNITKKLIMDGEIIVFPTETVYGIGANALNENAVKKIFEAKGRPSDNPLIIHLAEKDDIKKVAQNITEIEQKLIDNFMPGPFTIILKKKSNISDIVSGGLDTIGIRIPNNKIAYNIIKSCNVPIAAPSANISGKPSGTTFEDIKEELENKVSLIINGGKTQIGLESTVVKVIDDVPIILRPGAVTDLDIIKVIGKCKIGKNVFNRLLNNTKVESPGMKYKHYAPETKCKLINISDDLKQIETINKITNDYKGDVVILGFEEHKNKIIISKDRFISLGSKSNLENIASIIYSSLRKADRINSRLIIIEGVERKGFGIAIMNRLIRTCEYDVVEG